jgi:hypothetical protein
MTRTALSARKAAGFDQTGRNVRAHAKKRSRAGPWRSVRPVGGAPAGAGAGAEAGAAEGAATPVVYAPRASALA